MVSATERSASLSRMVWIGAAGIVGVALAAAALLWAQFGTVVFFEMIRAGIAYCF